MKTLILYASNSGNTRLVANRLGQRLADRGWPVTVTDVAGATPQTLNGYQLIILGSCTWERTPPTGRLEGQLPEHMHRFAQQLQAQPPRLQTDRFAVFALGRQEYTAYAAAANHLKVLVNQLGGRLVAPVLKIDGFPHHQQAAIDDWADLIVATGGVRATA